MKRAFTLIEVELALFVFSVGVLAMVGLYPLGFRESRSAREEVVAGAAAEGTLSRIVSSLSDTNLTWSAWKEIRASGEVSSLKGVFADVPAGYHTKVTLMEGDASRICIGVRVARNATALVSAPLYYSEVRFQGRFE